MYIGLNGFSLLRGIRPETEASNCSPFGLFIFENLLVRGHMTKNLTNPWQRGCATTPFLGSSRPPDKHDPQLLHSYLGIRPVCEVIFQNLPAARLLGSWAGASRRPGDV